jgi:hypothetical protein
MKIKAYGICLPEANGQMIVFDACWRCGSGFRDGDTGARDAARDATRDATRDANDTNDARDANGSSSRLSEGGCSAQ